MRDSWVRRVGDNVYLSPAHGDEGWYEVLRYIEKLEGTVDMLEGKIRNMDRMLKIAKAWNKCSDAELEAAAAQEET